MPPWRIPPRQRDCLSGRQLVERLIPSDARAVQTPNAQRFTERPLRVGERETKLVGSVPALPKLCHCKRSAAISTVSALWDEIATSPGRKRPASSSR